MFRFGDMGNYGLCIVIMCLVNIGGGLLFWHTTTVQRFPLPLLETIEKFQKDCDALQPACPTMGPLNSDDSDGTLVLNVVVRVVSYYPIRTEAIENVLKEHREAGGRHVLPHGTVHYFLETEQLVHRNTVRSSAVGESRMHVAQLLASRFKHEPRWHLRLHDPQIDYFSQQTIQVSFVVALDEEDAMPSCAYDNENRKHIVCDLANVASMERHFSSVLDAVLSDSIGNRTLQQTESCNCMATVQSLQLLHALLDQFYLIPVTEDISEDWHALEECIVAPRTLYGKYTSCAALARRISQHSALSSQHAMVSVEHTFVVLLTMFLPLISSSLISIRWTVEQIKKRRRAS